MTTVSWRVITAAIIVLTPLVVGVYDLVAYLRGGNNATISKTCLDTAREYPLFAICVVFAFGALCGHLFVPQHLPPE